MKRVEILEFTYYDRAIQQAVHAGQLAMLLHTDGYALTEENEATLMERVVSSARTNIVPSLEFSLGSLRRIYPETVPSELLTVGNTLSRDQGDRSLTLDLSVSTRWPMASNEIFSILSGGLERLYYLPENAEALSAPEVV